MASKAELKEFGLKCVEDKVTQSQIPSECLWFQKLGAHKDVYIVGDDEKVYGLYVHPNKTNMVKIF